MSPHSFHDWTPGRQVSLGNRRQERMRLRRAKLARVSHLGRRPASGATQSTWDVLRPFGALVRPPVALSVDVGAAIFAETGCSDHDDLEPVGPGFVASPRTGWDTHGVPL